MDLCVTDSSQCLMDDYRNFCYANWANVLSQTTMSLDTFVPWWSAQVATALNLDQATLESLYGPDDVYNTNHSVRDFWKYACNSGVSGTPTAFVNQIPLDSVPTTVNGWMEILNTVYASQYHPPSTTRLNAP